MPCSHFYKAAISSCRLTLRTIPACMGHPSGWTLCRWSSGLATTILRLEVRCPIRYSVCHAFDQNTAVRQVEVITELSLQFYLQSALLAYIRVGPHHSRLCSSGRTWIVVRSPKRHNEGVNAAITRRFCELFTLNLLRSTVLLHSIAKIG